MIRAAVCVAVLAAPATAETLVCRMTPDCDAAAPCAMSPADITFAIDRNQFAPPVDAREPPRVKRTYVDMNGKAFVAEPFLMQGGAVRGFWTTADASGTRMLTTMADGSARYSDSRSGDRMTGRCREVS